MADSDETSTQSPPEKSASLSPAELETGAVITEAPPSPRAVKGFSWFLVVVATLSSIFLYALDNTIVADIIPKIVNDFDSVQQLSWLSVGFMLGGVAVIMPLGKIYGLFNVKWVYIFSVVLFEAASALCGGAPNMAAMIVGRVFAGAGGIGMYIGTMTLISVNTSDQERPAYLGLVGIVWGAGTVLGPVIGGGFEDYNWRFAFYINLFIGALIGPVYIWLLPGVNFSAGVPLKQRLSSFDYIGAILSIGAVATILMAINFGGTQYAWNSGQIIALFIVSGVLFIAFGIQQKFTILTTRTTRMFPIHFFRNKEAILLHVLCAAGNAALFVPIYYIPIYFQFTRGDTALDSAVRLLPLIIILVAFILSNGLLMSKLGYYWPWYLLGGALALVANVLLSRITATTAVGAIYGFEVLLGIGAGSFVQAGYAVIQAVVDPADTNYAIGFMMIAQIGGIALGLSISGSVFVNRATSTLASLLPNAPLSQITQAIAGTSGALFDSLDASERQVILDAIVSALQKVFIVAYVGGAVAVVAGALLRRKRVFVPAAAGA